MGSSELLQGTQKHRFGEECLIPELDVGSSNWTPHHIFEADPQMCAMLQADMFKSISRAKSTTTCSGLAGVKTAVYGG